MDDRLSNNHIRWWQPVLFAAMAGGMGWGIRGQYGHETGAMIAGVLVSLTLACLLCRHLPALAVMRAVALGTVAMGFGGSMTYGQTLGLTQNPSMIGNWEALHWGLLGCAIKGGVWIGFAGVFLGMGLGGIRYRAKEILPLMLSLVVFYFVGVMLFNKPFDPANRMLPPIYFSAHWYWQPDVDVADLKPRPECWGGLWLALLATVGYAGFWRKDRLARHLALWGVLGGALGFPLGQCLQAYHAWNVESFQEGIWENLDPFMNWWNVMETTFGAVMGGVLGLGLWLNRKRIQAVAESPTDDLRPELEWSLVIIHVSLLATAEFSDIRSINRFYDLGLIMGVLPMTAIVGGRWWPYLMILPVTLVPIAGKTVLELVYENQTIAPALGWLLYLIVPLIVATWLAIGWARQGMAGQTGHELIRRALLFNTWLYFLLNYAFFRFPWPWVEWTGRTPSGIVFTICAVCLTVMAFTIGKSKTEAGLAQKIRSFP